MSERTEVLWMNGWSANARHSVDGYGGIDRAVHAVRYDDAPRAMCGFVVGEYGDEVPASDIGCKRCQRAIAKTATAATKKDDRHDD